MPVDQTRRRFLSQAAGVAASGAVLALATASPVPAAAAPEPILGLIADHKAAIAATDVAMWHYEEMEQAIPDDRRKGDFGLEVDEVATDDPRWTAACHRFCDAFRKSDEIALEMLDTPINSIEALAAFMAYAGEHTEQGLLWPQEVLDDSVDDKSRDWIEWAIIKAAATMRTLSAVVA
jgi:hypothetical protein